MRWLLCAVLACTPATYPPPHILVKLDTAGLSAAQRGVVWEAEDSWLRQTNGCIRFVEGAGVRVVRMDPYDKYDTDATYTMGMTTPGRLVELNYARFVNLDQAVVVAAHELGHVLGMSHTEGQHDLMNRDIARARLSLSQSDRVELAKNTGCF